MGHDDCDYDDDNCHYCGGDGFVWGNELNDPLWYAEDVAYECPCCRGSGLAKDCTFW